MIDLKKTTHTDARQRYEKMTAAEIDAELLHFGIDAGPTIEAVTKLVHAKLEERRARGRLHRQEIRLIGTGARRCTLHSTAGPPHSHVDGWSMFFLHHVENRTVG